jgi:hypothetical protein
VVNFLEATVYFIVLPGEQWLLVATVLLRTLLLLALSVEYGLILFDVKRPRLRLLHRRASAAFVVCVLAVLCGMLWPLGRAYSTTRYEAEEYRPVIEVIQARSPAGKAALILAEQHLYRRLYPFLWRSVDLYLAPEGDHLSAIATAHDELWLLTYEPPIDEVQNWLSEHAELAETYEFSGGKLYRYHAP